MQGTNPCCYQKLLSAEESRVSRVPVVSPTCARAFRRPSCPRYAVVGRCWNLRTSPCAIGSTVLRGQRPDACTRRREIVIEETAYIVRSELFLKCRNVALEDRALTEVARVASTAA